MTLNSVDYSNIRQKRDSLQEPTCWFIFSSYYLIYSFPDYITKVVLCNLLSCTLKMVLEQQQEKLLQNVSNAAQQYQIIIQAKCI